MKTMLTLKSRAKLGLVPFLILISLSVIPQNRNQQVVNRKDRIDNFKIAFLTRKMDLSTQESQKFWPVYNEFEKKLKELENSSATMRNLDEQTIEAMSDKALEDMLKAYMDNVQKTHELRKKYHDDLINVLPLKKVVRYYLAEREFKKELVRMAIEKREQRRK